VQTDAAYDLIESLLGSNREKGQARQLPKRETLITEEKKTENNKDDLDRLLIRQIFFEKGDEK